MANRENLQNSSVFYTNSLPYFWQSGFPLHKFEVVEVKIDQGVVTPNYPRMATPSLERNSFYVSDTVNQNQKGQLQVQTEEVLLKLLIFLL